ncbi:MAG: GNAT family N-acetyltransferase [Acidimicrobiales bacterium]
MRDLPLGHAVKNGGFTLRRVPLIGVDVTLREVRPSSDAKGLFMAAHGHDEMWTYMGMGPFASVIEMTRFLDSTTGSADPFCYIVERNSDQQPLGMVSYLHIQPDHACIEIGGIWYTPEAQRTVVNTEAAYLLLGHAFSALNCRRVEWKCDSLNSRSRAAALRLGFGFEGIFRQHMIAKGRNRDTAWYAMLDSDWVDAGPRLRRWLYEIPRDENGRPTESLSGSQSAD